MQFKEDWIKSGLRTEAIEHAKYMGEQMVEKEISTSQIRNVFGEIKKIQALGLEQDSKGRARLYMVAPKLAYITGRLGKKGDPKVKVMGELLNNVEIAINCVEQEDSTVRFNHFVDYMEAIVAYHRFNGGKN